MFVKDVLIGTCHLLKCYSMLDYYGYTFPSDTLSVVATSCYCFNMCIYILC